MIQSDNQELIHVLRTQDAEYLSTKALYVVGEKTFPMAQVLDPLYVCEDTIAIGEIVHILGGQISDLLFTFEEFIALAKSEYFTSVTGDEASRLVDYLRVKFSVGG